MAPSPPLQVIALISGGKDSFFSLLHCLANNHQIIALANLHPPPPPPSDPTPPPQDLNSYMYQTVGHTLIPLYARALALPLYRAPITGSAANAQKEYHPPASHSRLAPSLDDETEALLPLLRHILALHPAATALCAGAILSTYQRTRIESVARRLGLVPLAYLWQYPMLPTPRPAAGGLLADMVAVGLEARIVKVASGGLDEGLLWGDLGEEGVRRRLERGVGRFGGSVLGEGGEYETVCLEGPRGVWKGRLVVGEREVRRGEGGEAWVEFKEGAGRVEMFEERGEDGWRERLKIPSLWDERFGRLVREVGEGCGVRRVEGEMEVEVEGQCVKDNDGELWSVERSIVQTGSTLFVSNMTCSTKGQAIEDQVAQIGEELVDILATSSRSPSDIVFTSILLRSITDFSRVNHVYGKMFTMPNPPARVTIACGNGLPQGIDLIVSVAVDLGARQDRSGLHVQSRSYWAPANIGPYSQAISVKIEKASKPSLVYVAGQIPLVPASMEVLETITDSDSPHDMFRSQAVLSLQHLWRIGFEMDVSWWAGAVAFLVGKDDAWEKAVTAWRYWKYVHQCPVEDGEDDEDLVGELDAWDRKYGGFGSFSLEPETRRVLPDFDCLSSRGSPELCIPGFFAVQVDQLPRACEIEWQSLGIAHSKVQIEPCSVGDITGQKCTLSNSKVAVSYFAISESDSRQQSHARCLKLLESLQVEYCVAGSGAHWTLYTSCPAAYAKMKGQIVPCKRIWGADGVELAAGLVLRLETEVLEAAKVIHE